MPEVESLSWKDKIAASKTTSFAALDVGRYNVEILEVNVKNGAKGDWLQIKTKVADGPRANARVGGRSFPNASNVSRFIQLIESVGLSIGWLTGEGGFAEPTIEEIASALVGRKMSAEVFIEKDAQDDNNGEKWRSIQNFKPYIEGDMGPTPSAGGAPAPSAAPAPAPAPAPANAAPAQNGGWGSAAQAAVAPQANAAPAQGLNNPWGQ